MKISAFHKQHGHEVEMYQPLFRQKYDKVYASKIFSFSDGSLLDDGMDIGGAGYSIEKILPDEIERLVPDYSIYGYEHSLGYLMRGCRLNCDFCIVPKKEGMARSVRTIMNVWTQRDSKFITLLDNDFFGNPEWRDRIAEIKLHGLTVCFCQGLNIRNITTEQAEALASIRFINQNRTKKQVFFAWDNINEEKQIRRGIKKCMDAGIRPAQMAFFVLIGFNTTHEEDMHRVETLRGFGCDPYVMPYNKADPYQKKFARWVNHKAIFKSVPWNMYGVKSSLVNDSQYDLFDRVLELT
jgi:hypothetical protein